MRLHRFLPFLFVLLIGLCLSACRFNRPNSIKPSHLPGGDRDAHQCIPSAGYQWSELKQTCIRPFELPLKLYNTDKTYGAFVCFSNDENLAEIFSPEGHWLLQKTTDNRYLLFKPKSINIVLEKIQEKWQLNIQDHQAVYIEPAQPSL